MADAINTAEKPQEDGKAKKLNVIAAKLVEFCQAVIASPENRRRTGRKHA